MLPVLRASLIAGLVLAISGPTVAQQTTGAPVDDKDYKVPFAFTGKINKITLTIDRPTLTPEDEKRLIEAQRSKKSSE